METKRKFKFVGNEFDAEGYGSFDGDKGIPKIGEIYDEDVKFGGDTVIEWATDDYIKHEWEEVEEDFKSPDDYYAGQKNVLSISGICGGVVFSLSGDFVKCGQILNYIFNLETKQ